MYTVDLNSDLGESFGNYKIGNDDKVIPLISSANVACGYHASDPVVMGNTLAMAKEAGIRIGAHPGFPDLMGFGRRNLSVSPAEAKAYVLYQLGALDAFCRVTGVKMQHVKPHGALYNMAAEDYALSTAICEAIKEFDSSLIVLALSGGQQQRLCIARTLAVNPDVILMDEPTSALDPISTSKIEELALELKKDYTIIIVTHSMQQAKRISNKTAFFLLGEVIEFDETEKLFSNPSDERTDAYINGRFG